MSSRGKVQDDPLEGFFSSLETEPTARGLIERGAMPELIFSINHPTVLTMGYLGWSSNAKLD
ncbi:hypothetical protein CWO90_42240 [Bradyrhizobium sp. Leo121]|nr:hypothetical protein CWO90_42240 [Bradyrhizobium sp. Leo121]